MSNVLTETTLGNINEVKNQEGSLDYPCVILSGIELEEEITYIKNIKSTGPNVYSMYVEFSGIRKKAGYISLTLDTLIELKLVLNVQITVCKSPLDSKILDLSNGGVLARFIMP